MAKIEEFFGTGQVNLTASVGRRGVNAKSDVLVIQALMKYALSERKAWQGTRFPEPSGAMDGNTLALIKRYQQAARRQSRNTVAVDGRIDPAKGERPHGSRGLWTILRLNSDAIETWILNGAKNASYINDIAMRLPAFRHAVGDDPCGRSDLR